MSLEQTVADLVTATTQLTDAINVKKADLDTASNTAVQSASAASASASTSSAAAVEAVAAAAQASEVSGLDTVEEAIDYALPDALAKADPARHPFRGKLPSLALEFSKNRYHVVGDYGLEPQQLTDVLTVSNGASTRVDHRGQIVPTAVNQPVIDYDPATGECLGLSVQEQHTNYATNSHTHTSTENADGSQTTTFLDGNPANIYVANTVAAAHRAVKSGLSGGDATIARPHSAFIKIPADSDAIRLWFRARSSAGGGKGFQLDLTDKGNPVYAGNIPAFGTNPPTTQVTQSDVLIERWSDGWWRIGFIGATSNNASDVHTRLDVGCSVTTTETDPGTVNTKLIVTGWQLTKTSLHMPYIKTEGSAVTRVADILQPLDINSIFNPQSFTVFIRIKEAFKTLGTGDSNASWIFRVSETDSDNIASIRVRKISTSSHYYDALIRIGSSTVWDSADFSIPDIDQTPRVLVLRVHQGVVSFFVGSVKVGEVNLGSLLTSANLNRFRVGGSNNTALKEVLIYQYLTDAEILELSA